ncbi:putative magnesium transport MgtC family protein [Sphaerisporangium siamense]|uniref:Putative Mg2+ transporter-C (MgtC) family protein n=1 Tax=Sphaerisporangium siamense TaxID=795645 RepID=A0A7W7D581_9ACTN|nr:MgtC/SapB family protein [Sphaerisporangium siamense]MBB4700517.1 putative Mg2+ transporter-C (MgtC) family protein [Sphaerisporangium siamense]GII88320.1 putative magnesium transport MgtC family protein [Sphaerisporangium siamense]
MVLRSAIDLTGQGWVQVGELALAFVLSAAIGAEREARQKSAGLRTHTSVGFAAALIMIVSKYGFGDVLGDHVTLDPSRVAAQIVSGIGFIGAGLIFIRRDAVRGLTTAATIWLTAAVGMAAGAGLWLLALIVTAGHFALMFLLGPLARRLPVSRFAPTRLHLRYLDGRGVLRTVMAACAEERFTLSEVSVDQQAQAEPGTVTLWLTVHGSGSPARLVARLSEIDGVLAVAGQDADSTFP